jgi:hypothetical protein
LSVISCVMLWRLKILCGQGEAGKLMEQGL